MDAAFCVQSIFASRLCRLEAQLIIGWIVAKTNFLNSIVFWQVLESEQDNTTGAVQAYVVAPCSHEGKSLIFQY